MKIPLKKFLFIGKESDHDRFFKRAQEVGVMEFLSLSKRKAHIFPKYIEDIRFAIKCLRKLPVRTQKSRQISEAHIIVEEVLALNKEVDQLHEEIRLLRAEIVKVHPVGEFHVEELAQLSRESGKEIQFFFIRHDKISKENLPRELIFINREYDFDYFIYIGKEKFVHPAFVELIVKHSLHSLEARKKMLEEKSHQKEQELKTHAAYIDFLHDFLLHELNKIYLNFAKTDISTYLEGHLFAIEAWIPENKLYQIDMVTRGLPIYSEEVAILPDDVIPTYLENSGFAKIGEDLVHIYDTPSTSDKDPSGWVLWAFILFFSMIVADAGYGCLFLTAALIFRMKYPKLKGVKKRILTLFTLIASGCIIWGVLIGSYFSIKLEPDNFLNKSTILYQLARRNVDYHIIHKDEAYKDWIEIHEDLKTESNPDFFLKRAKVVKNGVTSYDVMQEVYDNVLLEIALLVGMIHLSLSLIRNFYRNWAGIGWIAMIWGGYLFFPKVVGGTPTVQYLGFITPQVAEVVGSQLLYGGLGVAMVLAIIQTKWLGLASLFKVIELFADTLSYLRLYALGLASMVMAATFNEIGTEMVGNYLIGALIILFGHTINITLALMAGTIHGLRLNFLEWYHHCFEGGGKQFYPLRLLIRE